MKQFLYWGVSILTFVVGVTIVWFYISGLQISIPLLNEPNIEQTQTLQKIQAPDQTREDITQNVEELIDKRLNQFIEAQQKKDWVRVSDIIGQFHGKPSDESKYTDQQKQCLIDLMKSSPLLSLKQRRISLSSELFSLPRNQWWWIVSGAGEFKTSSGSVTKNVYFTAYQENGELFFVPPIYLEGDKEKLTNESSLNLKDYFKVVEQSDCPLEIFDIRVRQNPKNHSGRIVSLKLRNKTKKKILSFGYELEAGASVGKPTRINPGQIISIEENYNGYSYYCEGEQERKFYIDSISFSDGTEWESNLNRLN